MKKIISVALGALLVTSSVLPAQAGSLGETIVDTQSAIFESLATQVTASRDMNTAEETKIVAPKTQAEATVATLALDDKGDLAKDKADAALQKAADYLTLANEATTAKVRTDYTTASSNYQKTAYFYSVAADLYLVDQQKTAALAAKLPDSPTAADKASVVSSRSLADAQKAVTEAKAELGNQKNALDVTTNADQAQLQLGTYSDIDQADNTLHDLWQINSAKKESLLTLAANYTSKAAASTGSTKTAYTTAATTYRQAASVADAVVVNANSARENYGNALPENPANPGDNLKWHMFQSNPDTAVAVMKYNFAQLAFSSIRWQTEAQNVALNTDSYLTGDHGETIQEYIDGFRTSSMQYADGAKDLLDLVGRYYAQVPAAAQEDAAKWQLAASYLVDIVATYAEVQQAQYQIYLTLSAAQGTSVKTATLVTQTAEAKTVLKAGEKAVAVAGELTATVTAQSTTEFDVYTTKPGEKVSIALSKAGAKTVTVTDVADDSGLATATINKSYAGYTATVTLAGKVIDKEAVPVTK
jgi:hypothetical protein